MFFAFWAIYFSYLAHLQVQEVFPRQDQPGYTEVRHMFSGFAVNAPAWSASEFLYKLFSTGSFSKTSVSGPYDDFFSHSTFSFGEMGAAPWEYFGLVILMWFLIGSRLDQWRRGKNPEERYRLSEWGRIIWSLCALYSLWLFYKSTGTFYAWTYEIWFPIAVMVWSAVATCGSFYVLARDGRGW